MVQLDEAGETLASANASHTPPRILGEARPLTQTRGAQALEPYQIIANELCHLYKELTHSSCATLGNAANSY